MSNAPADSQLVDALLDEGILTQIEVESALEEYRVDSQRSNFASYLLQRGVISVNQLAAVTETALSDPSEAPPSAEGDHSEMLGKRFSGCIIERFLASGGMGTVFEARREADDRAVVVKFLSKRMASNESIRQRFLREGRMLWKLPMHPGLVQVLAVSEEDEQPHLVMELVEGLSLARVLDEQWMLPHEEAVRIARDVAQALAIVHAKGMVHRDIKPANIILTPTGGVKIVDFGLAKDMDATALTLPGMCLGTPLYMAPEQWEGHGISPRCDVFALGATLYHLIVGRPPFVGPSQTAVREAILVGDYPPPRMLVPGLPTDLELVIAQMLLCDRRFRYPEVRTCAEDLDRILAGEPARFPRLEREGPSPQRFPLLPGRQFTLGRDETCDIQIDEPWVSRQHALLRREHSGFVLRDLASSCGTVVGGVPLARPFALRDSDTVELGRARLRFFDPWEEPAKQLGETERTEVPALIHQALVQMGDPRTVLSLIDGLAPDELGARLAEQKLITMLGDDADPLFARRASQAARLRSTLHLRLTKATGEEQPEGLGWVSWWEGARERFPAQIVPEESPREFRLIVREGEFTGTDFDLNDREVFRLGRDPERATICLSHPTVSRWHATIYRLHQRLVIRDEGSRLGTLVNDAPCRLTWLDAGDTITLGQVKLVVWAGEAKLRRIGLNSAAVDPITYETLERAGHASVTTALLAFLSEPLRPKWIEAASRDLFPTDEASRAQFMERACFLLEQRRKRANALLPKLLGEPQDARARRAHWTRRLVRVRSDLPRQVLPEGWLETTCGLYGGQRQT